MTATADIQTLFEAGSHFGYVRARRHPTAAKYLFGTKDRTDVFDLEETGRRLEAATAFAASVAASGKHVLFVGGKHEALGIVKSAAERVGAPYVTGRRIGGNPPNFQNI